MEFITKQMNMTFVGIEERPKKSNPEEHNSYAVFENQVEQQFRHYLRNPELMAGVEAGATGTISISCKEEWRDGRTTKSWDFVKFTKS